MKTKSYKVYSFSELSPQAQRRALEDHAEFLGQVWSGEFVIEDAKQCLAHAGFSIDRIGYSGFWSQGDGAHFEGSWRARDVDPAKMREHAPVDKVLHSIADQLAAIAEKWPEASFTVRHRGFYSHENCTVFDFDMIEDRAADLPPGADAAEDRLAELAREAMRWIYRQLEADYDWHTEEEQALESIQANGYEFTEDGKID